MYIYFISFSSNPQKGTYLDGIPRFGDVKWLAGVHRAWCGQNQSLMRFLNHSSFHSTPVNLENMLIACPVNFSSVSHSSQANPPQSRTPTVLHNTHIVLPNKYLGLDTFFPFPNLVENILLKPGCYLICDEPRRSFLYLSSQMTKELHTIKHFFSK